MITNVVNYRTNFISLEQMLQERRLLVQMLLEWMLLNQMLLERMLLNQMLLEKIDSVNL